MERAKQVTMGELNASIGQQLQAQHLSQHAQGLPMGPHPSGLSHPGLALGGGPACWRCLALWGLSWLPKMSELTWRQPPPLPPPRSTTEVQQHSEGCFTFFKDALKDAFLSLFLKV
ncbi:transducin-like enhancer protein 4 [Notothenia coriiceps]|uniref:Transducin-like enhancer protein 4 n=1 Tax=Notothenia coriiceps TaxID=8208 RepID=A0A6I9NQ83_9TELE|nr:PREDICTED: transducin-like enhancer protein 4 [Notothenia coriiceps]